MLDAIASELTAKRAKQRTYDFVYFIVSIPYSRSKRVCTHCGFDLRPFEFTSIFGIGDSACALEANFGDLSSHIDSGE